MYPIRIFGIQTSPDKPFEYALYDDTAHYEGREATTRFPSIDDVAVFVARVLYEVDPETAFRCISEPQFIFNLITFSARRLFLDSNGVPTSETRLLTSDERVSFLESLNTELRSVEFKPKE